MFTGIVQDLVSVREIVDEGDLVRLGLDMDATANALQLGASVAVNGTCLTVTRVVRGACTF